MADSLAKRIADAIRRGEGSTWLLPADGIESWARAVEFELPERVDAQDLMLATVGPSRTRPRPIMIEIGIDLRTGERVLDISSMTDADLVRVANHDHG